MIITKKHINEKLDNILLISGNGRNVGKTFLACNIIKFLSEKHNVTAVKISSHFHSVPANANVLAKTGDYIILTENQITKKDSSLMLQAGAEKVFYIMVKQQNIRNAFSFIQSFLGDKPVVIESGGLGEIIQPGLFFFVKRKGDEIAKNRGLIQNARMIENDGESFSLDIENLHFKNNKYIRDNNN